MEYTENNSSNSYTIIPIILSGGSGSRLWPLSRKCLPKQYLQIDDENDNTLLQNTFLRIKDLENISNPLIICNEEQRFIVAEQMREIDVKPNSILLEPCGRNTAPAIALAALQTNKSNDDPFLLILSADHQIKDKDEFKRKIKEGIIIANEGRIVTFGIIPDKPETGYGYIETERKVTKKNCSSKIKKFIEKPNIEVAKKLIKDKKYLWNSGIFLFKASTILNELKKYQPEIINLCEKSLNNKNEERDLNFKRLDENHFKKCPNISIDLAIMEKTNLGSVLALDVGWSDIGNWKSVWENSKKDKYNNSFKGKIFAKNTKNCYLRSESRLLVGIDIENIIAIETADAILIADINSAQSVKVMVNELLNNNFDEADKSKKIHRPWGNYTSVVEGETWQVKRLEINPGATLSLQMHYHRSEHWVVVDGTAKIELDGQISILSPNESIYVPLGCKHRLSNPGKMPLVLIEVQSGNYLGEDDIIRFKDVYGRIGND